MNIQNNIFKIWRWIGNNLFFSPFNTILTIVVIYLIYIIVPAVINWVFIDAIWRGSIENCRAEIAGACWLIIPAKLKFFIYGFYPDEHKWRVNIIFAILAFCISWLVIDSTPWKKNVVIFTLTIFPVFAYIFLKGRIFGINLLPYVPITQYGGLLLTILIGSVTIVFSLPCGIILALGRRSQLPVIKSVCVVFIEFWRGVPIITVLFMASVMLPLFLGDVQIDELNRALIGFILCSSAYLAEDIRGGLQGISKEQYEGADSLGLSYFNKMRLVILPQALTIVIPVIVNSFIGIFKETTLVLIIALTDFLGSVQTGLQDPKWFSYSTAFSGYAFAAAVYFIFCYSMSLYGKKMEKKLDRSNKNY